MQFSDSSISQLKQPIKMYLLSHTDVGSKNRIDILTGIPPHLRWGFRQQYMA